MRVRHSSTVVSQYVCTFVGLFELLTFVSWNSHTDCLSLALPPVERIVSYSRGQHGQLSVSVSASFILHLRTEWIHDWMNGWTSVSDHSEVVSFYHVIHSATA